MTLSFYVLAGFVGGFACSILYGIQKELITHNALTEDLISTLEVISRNRVIDARVLEEKPQ